jgi:hypothetical protein
MKGDSVDPKVRLAKRSLPRQPGPEDFEKVKKGSDGICIHL